MNPDKIWFTSDHHFAHANIIKFCDRPFNDAFSMGVEMWNRWNEVVGEDDIVFHLGDFTLGNWTEAQVHLTRLNGRIKMLSYPWHHDHRWLAGAVESERLELVPPMVVLEVPEYGDGTHPRAITLCHYPLEVWDRKHFGAWHLHGHSHGNCPAVPRRLDVGVDCHDFRPVSLAEVAAMFEEQERMEKEGAP